MVFNVQSNAKVISINATQQREIPVAFYWAEKPSVTESSYSIYSACLLIPAVPGAHTRAGEGGGPGKLDAGLTTNNTGLGPGKLNAVLTTNNTGLGPGSRQAERCADHRARSRQAERCADNRQHRARSRQAERWADHGQHRARSRLQAS